MCCCESPGDGATDHHADAALLSSRTHFQSLIHHQVHEGIKSTQDSLNVSASVQLHCSKASVYTFIDGRNDSIITPSDVTFVQVVLLQHKTRRSETCTMLLCTTAKVKSKNSKHEAEFYSHESFLSMNLEKRNAYLHTMKWPDRRVLALPTELTLACFSGTRLF